MGDWGKDVIRCHAATLEGTLVARQCRNGGSHPPIKVSSWSRLIMGLVKMNANTAFSLTGSDCPRQPREVRWMWRSHIYASSAFEAKMIGVYLTHLLVRFRNLKEVQIEGDNQSVVLTLHRKSSCPDWRFTPLFYIILDSVKFFILLFLFGPVGSQIL